MHTIDVEEIGWNISSYWINIENLLLKIPTPANPDFVSFQSTEQQAREGVGCYQGGTVTAPMRSISSGKSCPDAISTTRPPKTH